MRHAAAVLVCFALACGTPGLPLGDLGVGDLAAADASMMSSGLDGPCWVAHLCVKASCCDPTCDGISDGQDCRTAGAGYYCAFLGHNCTCALDARWHCHPAPSDMAYRDMTIVRDLFGTSD